MLFPHQCSESHEIETAALGGPLKSRSIDVYFVLSLPRLKPQVGPFFPIVSSARLRERWTWLMEMGFVTCFSAVIHGLELAWSTDF